VGVAGVIAAVVFDADEFWLWVATGVILGEFIGSVAPWITRRVPRWSADRYWILSFLLFAIGLFTQSPLGISGLSATLYLVLDFGFSKISATAASRPSGHFHLRYFGLTSSPSPPRPSSIDADVAATLVVDAAEQGSLVLDQVPVVELSSRLRAWTRDSRLDDIPFEYRSLSADETVILWFRPWRAGWVVGSPWVEVGPLLVEKHVLIAASESFVASLRSEVLERWGIHET
jgi:hypothetical protein